METLSNNSYSYRTVGISTQIDDTYGIQYTVYFYYIVECRQFDIAKSPLLLYSVLQQSVFVSYISFGSHQRNARSQIPMRNKLQRFQMVMVPQNLQQNIQ